eukprot:3815763-Rhodomonas_salina.1
MELQCAVSAIPRQIQPHVPSSHHPSPNRHQGCSKHDQMPGLNLSRAGVPVSAVPEVPCTCCVRFHTAGVWVESGMLGAERGWQGQGVVPVVRDPCALGGAALLLHCLRRNVLHPLLRLA